ncbi:hypothetical protein V5799_024449 [Amblyomma americanum]|uniref:Uncharacterized protein n=1 Tax=Amblyomma americanum TaxID=6943 RepID=A0AAQ4EC02_AMBAM
MTRITRSRRRTKGRREVHARRSPDDAPFSSSSSPFTATTASGGAPPGPADDTDECLSTGSPQKPDGARRHVGVDADETAATAPETSPAHGSTDSEARAAAWKAHTEGNEPVKVAGGGGQGLDEATTQPKSGAEDGGPRSQCSEDSATGASGRRARGTEGTAARGAVARGVVAARRGFLSATTSTSVRSTLREGPRPPPKVPKRSRRVDGATMRPCR